MSPCEDCVDRVCVLLGCIDRVCVILPMGWSGGWSCHTMSPCEGCVGDATGDSFFSTIRHLQGQTRKREGGGNLSLRTRSKGGINSWISACSRYYDPKGRY